MTETPRAYTLNSYRIPSDGIQRNRRVFYGLRRKSDESISQWLNRVKSYIRHCEFSRFKEFLLIDRFVCGLNPNELATIQNLKKCWTVKQLLEHYLDEDADQAKSVVDNNIDEKQDNESESVCSLLSRNIRKSDFTLILFAN